MTRQESFKRRIRARMEKTGERYVAARRVLVEQATRRARKWVAEPEVGDDAVREATGRGWEEWCELIDAWPGNDRGHTAIAGWLNNDIGVEGWWAQTVTLGYERITGRRLPYQQPDGTFSANKTKTVQVDAELLRKMLLDDGHRSELFPGQETELRSRPASKVVRLGIGPCVAQIALEPRADGRTTVSVAHEKLPDADSVEQWRFYWNEWLDALDDAWDARDGTR